MKKVLHNRAVISVILSLMAFQAGAQDVIVSSFNSSNVILPSSYYTPDDPYDAIVWVYNTGQSYDETYYNYIWATPDQDADGREWYEYDYDLEQDYTWIDATAPFSSDEYYNGYKSYRWITSDIMGDIYIRRYFTIDEDISRDVYLSCGHDDAPSEWYINGTLVHSVSDGWEEAAYTLLDDDSKALLYTDGTTENVLAVHVHQNWGGAYADCGLYEADMTLSHYYLAPVTAVENWPCLIYLLNSNDDFDTAEDGGWYTVEEDESDWFETIGPFSVDDNSFFITEWPSTLRPLLVRRHFELSSSDLASIEEGTVKLTISYDEDPKVYLNGTLIYSTTGWNDNDYAEVELSDEQKALLVEGDNLLAVSLEQGDGGGHIDYGIYLETDYDPSTVTTGVNAVEVKETAISDNRVYSITGQYLGTSTSGLRKGIYIINGKKRIIGQ